MKPDNYCQRTQYVGVTLGGIPYCSGRIPDCTDGDGNIDDPAKAVGEHE